MKTPKIYQRLKKHICNKIWVREKRKEINENLFWIDTNLMVFSERAKIFDSRENIASYFKDANILIGEYIKILKKIEIKPNSYFIIVTHSHEIDYSILNYIYTLNCKPKYIGVIASDIKSEVMIKRLVHETEYKKELLEKIYCPIGLKIGGSSPTEIAVAIISELQSIKYKKLDISFSRKNFLELLT